MQNEMDKFQYKWAKTALKSLSELNCRDANWNSSRKCINSHWKEIATLGDVGLNNILWFILSLFTTYIQT